MPLEKGALLNNRYRIENTIAAGGMGAVHRAHDETLGIEVALKENFFSTEEYSRQFRREATILASLRHPNLPRVTDHFVIPGQGQYLVMDFIAGSDLRELISRSGTLPEAEVTRIGMFICDALTYLHSRNPAIVHRDIKPGNIKITPTGQVVLVDFGLAKLSHGEATTTGAQGLTPGYAPPEQYGQGTEPRSDIYALGATLYVALTGQIPEDGLSRAMGSAELTPIRRQNPAVSDKLARSIEKALAVAVDERYPTAEEFKQSLLGAAAKIPQGQAHPAVAEKPPEKAAPVFTPATQKTQRDVATVLENPAAEKLPPLPAPRRKPRTGVVIAVVSTIVLLGGAAALFALGIIPPRSSPQPTAVLAETRQATQAPPTPTQEPSPTTEQVVLPSPTTPPSPSSTPAPTATPAAAPTATPTIFSTPVGGTGQIAFSSDRGGSVQVWIMDADGSNARQVTSLTGGACQADWSPDGKRLVFISPCAGKKDEYAGASLFLINSDGSGLVPLPSQPGGDFDPAWSPDGSQIAFTSLREGLPHIYLYNLSDRSVKRISSPVVRDRRAAWSPDGQRIAYETTRLGSFQIWTMAPDGKDAREFSVLEGSYEVSPAWSPDGTLIVYSQSNQPLLIARQYGNPTAREIAVSDTLRPVDEARFSPDGWWLIFTYVNDGNTDIYRMNANNGTDLTRLTDADGVDFHPAWIPAQP